MKKKSLLLPALMLSLAASSAQAVTVIDYSTTQSFNLTTNIENQATDGKGGAYLFEDTTLSSPIMSDLVANIEGSIFSNNSATGNGYGGAIFLRHGTLNISNNAEFNNNTASWDGGAISTAMPMKDALGNPIPDASPLLVINDAIFNGNSAVAYSGGAIGLYSRAEIYKTAFLNNNAGGAIPPNSTDGGGAIYMGGWAQAVIKECAFEGNSSNRGGAISTTDGVGGNYGFEIADSVFVENTATVAGGAIYSKFDEDSAGKVSSVTNSDFIENSTEGKGGAIFSAGEMNIADSTFKENFADDSGGAIHTSAAMKIENSSFVDNHADSANGGGAIKIAVGTNNPEERVVITDSRFEGNYANAATADSGAISIQDGYVDISKTDFIGNKADWGGAIYAYKASDEINITDCLFEANEANDIGAVGNFTKDGLMTLTNVIFRNNKAVGGADSDGGGALFVGSESTTLVKDSFFEVNSSSSVGGAIATRAETDGNNVDGKLEIINTVFDANTAASHGGAIYNAFQSSISDPERVVVKNSTFSNNKSAGDGGAIYNAPSNDVTHNAVADIIITDTSFIGNSAEGRGGAIFASGDVNISAVGKDVVFKGNSAADGGDIYMGTPNSNLNIELGEGGSIYFDGGISGNQSLARAASSQGYNVNITGSGTMQLDSYMRNANMIVNDATLQLAANADLNGNNNHITMNNGSTLDTINGQIDNFDAGLFSVNGTAKLAADIDLASGTGDNIGSAVGTDSNGVFEVTAINIEENQSQDVVSKPVDVLEALGLSEDNAKLAEEVAISNGIKTPVRYYKGAIENGMLIFAPTGNSSRDYNPSVLVSPVAAQLGGYLTQLNSYEQAFRNVDLNMLYTKKERRAMKMRNKYAVSEPESMKYNLSANKVRQDGVWARPFTSIEKVNLDGGPKVDSVSYGSYFGADSDMVTLKNGADVQYSVYAGYNGSHQSFSGNSMYQNGGTLGVSGVYYKDSLFSALTANIGASIVDASTMFGSEDFTMLMSGIASKTGYNWELKDGRFIVQPSLMLSYSFVNTFDYTNGAGARINADPLHAFHIAPGVKFIANTTTGWQPYASVSMNWNVLDETDVTAAQTSLPEMSVKPYVSYGVGVQKRWGERFTGFIQTMIRNGGRNGVAFSAGFKCAIGKQPIFNPLKKNMFKSL